MKSVCESLWPCVKKTSGRCRPRHQELAFSENIAPLGHPWPRQYTAQASSKVPRSTSRAIRAASLVSNAAASTSQHEQVVHGYSKQILTVPVRFFLASEDPHTLNTTSNAPTHLSSASAAVRSYMLLCTSLIPRRTQSRTGDWSPICQTPAEH